MVRYGVSRNNQAQQSGTIINGSLTGTGTNATMIAPQGKGYFVDILTLILTTSSAISVATISDGTNNYTFNLARGTVSISLPVPLKATSVNTAWILNAPNNVTVIWQAVILGK